MIPVTEFIMLPAPHVGNRLMVRCTRRTDSGEVHSWVEPHRLTSTSPTGPDCIIRNLRKEEVK